MVQVWLVMGRAGVLWVLGQPALPGSLRALWGLSVSCVCQHLCASLPCLCQSALRVAALCGLCKAAEPPFALASRLCVLPVVSLLTRSLPERILL